MRIRVFLILLAAFLFFYSLNYFMPLAFGDDYLYAFVWQGKPMFEPLTEDAIKVSSLRDLVVSQISFYFTWSGRIVNNTLAQLFVWAGKDVFNVANAFACLLLVMELYWCANRGKVSLCINEKMLCFLVLLFWLFSPGFPSVVFWLVGACHYLWPAVLLAGFLIPYIQKYYSFEEKNIKKSSFSCVIFLLGIVAGCTNENSVCWIILLITLFLCVNRKSGNIEYWMYIGLAGLILGYAFLMLAPGNYVRLHASHGIGWFNGAKLAENLHAFTIVLVYQFILWYFCMRSFFIINDSVSIFEEPVQENLRKELLLIKVLCLTSMCMTAIMIVSPEFHLRSAFPGTVQLFIAIAIILRIQEEYGIELLLPNAKRFLVCFGIAYFLISSGVTFHHLYKHREYNEKIMSQVAVLHKSGNEKKIILCTEPFQKNGKAIDFLSGYHTFDTDISDNADCWVNVAFARYYDIKGIRVPYKDADEFGKK